MGTRKNRYTGRVGMTKRIRVDFIRVIWIVGIIALFVWSARTVFRAVALLPKEPVSDRLRESAVRQGGWLINNQKPEGDFVYEMVSATATPTEDNNIVRQAGVLYGLAQLLSTSETPQLSGAFKKNLEYFRSITATVSAERAAIELDGYRPSNATALVVLGLTEYMDADKSRQTTQNLEYLTRLTNYLVSTQASHSAYFNDFIPTPKESDYNNGETMYALIRSFRITGAPATLESVRKAAEYFMDHYGTSDFNASFFSWGMAGFSYLYRVDPRDEYWQFLRTYADKYLNERGEWYEFALAGRQDAEIPPGAAVYQEGVAHIAWIAKEKENDLYRKLSRHTLRVLERLLRYEVNSPVGKYAVEDMRMNGAICATATCETTRIDFMQHNISAIVLYLRFLK